jgi:hypothetical protein
MLSSYHPMPIETQALLHAPACSCMPVHTLRLPGAYRSIIDPTAPSAPSAHTHLPHPPHAPHLPHPPHPLHPPHPPHPRTLRILQGCLTVARLLSKNAFGYAPTELEGKSVLGILHPADHAPFVQVSNYPLTYFILLTGSMRPSCRLRAPCWRRRWLTLRAWTRCLRSSQRKVVTLLTTHVRT